MFEPQAKEVGVVFPGLKQGFAVVTAGVDVIDFTWRQDGAGCGLGHVILGLGLFTA